MMHGWLTGSPGRKLDRRERAARDAYQQLQQLLADRLGDPQVNGQVFATVSAMVRAGIEPDDAATLLGDVFRQAGDIIEAECRTTFRDGGADHLRRLIRSMTN